MRAVEADAGVPGTRVAKAALFDALAEVAGALSAGRRVEIVDLLAQGERSVDEVAGEIGQSMANASHHLRALARAGLVRSRRDGTRIYYRLAGVEVEELWSALREVAAVDDCHRAIAQHRDDQAAEGARRPRGDLDPALLSARCH
jgi:DNA-binding transcriptional ArsR family regulator